MELIAPDFEAESTVAVERRAWMRRATTTPATARLCGNYRAVCIVKDYSGGGARLLFPAGAWIPDVFQLDCDVLALARTVRKVWVRGDVAGVAFQNKRICG